MSHLVYLGLGTNLGQRITNLQEALEEIRKLPGTVVLRCSSIFETQPWGVAEQPSFLNAVVEVCTDLDPAGLLSAVKSIESQLGRVETVRWGPRLIDIDILIYGAREVHDERLVIPHPQICNRLFVLVPLAELHPDWICPAGKTIVEAAAELWDKNQIQKTSYNLTINR